MSNSYTPPLTSEQLSVLNEIVCTCKSHDDKCTDCPFQILLYSSSSNGSSVSTCAFADLPLLWQLQRFNILPPISKEDQLFLRGLQYGGIDTIEIHDTYRNWKISSTGATGNIPDHILANFSAGVYPIAYLLNDKEAK